MMIWANLAIGIAIATLCLFSALMVGTLINQWNFKRKEYSSGGKFLDSLIREYSKKFSPKKTSQSHQSSTQSNEQTSHPTNEHNPSLNHGGIRQFYEHVFKIYERSEIEKERCELKKILDFLKDFSHPQSGPNWKLWASGFQAHWGFAPAKLAVLEGLELTSKLPASSEGMIAKTFFDYLERIVFIQMWSWEQFDNYLPANATATLSASLGIARQYQHVFASCWLLEIAGMPPISFMNQQNMAMEKLKKMTKEKRTLLIIKMASISDQNSFPNLMRKKFSLWFEQFGPGNQKNPPKQDYAESEYKVLGVSPQDSVHHIKKMYRKMALTYHPDQFANENLSEFERKAIEKRFVKIKTAYEKIISQKKKMG